MALLKTITISGSVAPAGSGAIEDDMVCDAAVSVRSVVYVGGDGVLRLASSTNAATMPAAGVVTAKTSPTQCTVATHGVVPNFVGLTPGATYYLGPDGTITATPAQPGDVGVQPVGVAANSTTLWVDVSPNHVQL